MKETQRKSRGRRDEEEEEQEEEHYPSTITTTITTTTTNNNNNNNNNRRPLFRLHSLHKQLVVGVGNNYNKDNKDKDKTTVMMESRALEVREVPTSPIAGQKTGTSGLRKRVTVFQQAHYLENWIQALFSSLEELGTLSSSSSASNTVLVVGGDGRYWNKEALQVIIRMAAANGFAKVLVGREGLISTPAMSAIIRQRKATGGIILTASHNPGGKEGDFGIKYNVSNGGPAPESITNKIYDHTQALSKYRIADLPELPLSEVGAKYEWEGFCVEVIDPVADYLQLLKQVFDFDAIRRFIQEKQFKMKLDAMHGVAAAYVRPIFVDELGVSEDALLHAESKEDFGGKHPDPNLTYAADLVEVMYSGDYHFGAAWDGDADRNMILGQKFFVNPSDSVAIIAANAQFAIPHFSSGLKAVARSMPTGAALDRVAEGKGLPLYEVPTGWKYFGNIMDHFGSGVICGEESFGTGSDHVREKDGIWAVLAWLSVLAHFNNNSEKLISVEDVVTQHWKTFGRNYFTRYDYEEVDANAADAMIQRLRDLQSKQQQNKEEAEVLHLLQTAEYELSCCDDFAYKDPFDGSEATKQGLRFVYKDGSRIIFRLSGTGSAGATIRLYVEKFVSPAGKLFMDTQEALKPLLDLALSFSKLEQFTGRREPSVIT
ncbi:phosphoglucomutase (alpha-D-glucose-1,6-bisphosphate-dependent) [Balamuthia mandrillaris]